MNRLPTNETFKQWLCVSAYKFVHDQAQIYMTDIFHKLYYTNNTRNTTIGQNSLSFIGPRRWNNLNSDLKLAENANTLKHRIKEEFFKALKKREYDIYLYY